MEFIPHTQEELQQMNIQNNNSYRIQYVNKDYFNAEETLEQAIAQALINEDKILFIVQDPFGMDKFVEHVKVLHTI